MEPLATSATAKSRGAYSRKGGDDDRQLGEADGSDDDATGSHWSRPTDFGDVGSKKDEATGKWLGQDIISAFELGPPDESEPGAVWPLKVRPWQPCPDKTTLLGHLKPIDDTAAAPVVEFNDVVRQDDGLEESKQQYQRTYGRRPMSSCGLQ